MGQVNSVLLYSIFTGGKCVVCAVSMQVDSVLLV